MCSRWEDLTLKPRGLEDAQPELMVSKYVDTDLKAVPSDGWDVWMKNIISTFSLMATTHITIMLEMHYTGLQVDHYIY